jgi:peptide/nickel transport system substrate-binding protein
MPRAKDRLTRRTYLKFAGAATATVSLAGCTGGDGDDGDGDGDGVEPTDTPTASPTDSPTPAPDIQVGITMGNMDSGLDPHDHQETNTNIVVRQGYNRLISRDPEGAVIESLASKWERVEKGTIRFTLRDATFHNGDSVTAEDAAYSIRRIVDDEVGFVSPQNSELGNVTEVEAGDGEVTVHYEAFNPIAFSQFTTNGEVLQQSWVEANDRDFINRNINGTGPFKLANYDAGNEVVFERYDDYWGGAPEVAGVTINSSTESSTRVNRLLAEESDIVTNVPAQEVSRVQNSDVASIKPVPSTRIIFLFMRDNVEPFSSQEFRQAMNYAVDVESIIENILAGFGQITGQPTLSEFVGYNPDVDPYPYDPARAEELVEESGFAGAEITLETPIGRYLADVEIAQAAGSQINELSNVSCDVEQRDFAALVQDLLTGNIEDKPHFNLLGWGNGEFDASQTIEPLLTTGGALTILENQEVDQLIEDAANEADPDAREAILQEANELLHELAPWVFMHQQFSVYGVSNRVDWEPRSDEDIDPYRASPN